MPTNSRGVLRLVAVFVVALLFAASCGSNAEPEGSSPDSTVAVSATEPPEPVVADEEVAEVGAPVEIEDTFALQNGSIEPLSGRPLDEADETLLSTRAIAVKIDNDEKARPQYGIEDADIIYEVLVENQITRLLAIFHSTLPETVGPVRSARSSDIDLMAPLANPLFAYSGSNDIVGQEVRNAQSAGLLVSTNFDQANSAYIDRQDRPAPHHRTLFPAKLNQDQFTNAPITVRPVFRYLSPDSERESVTTSVAGVTSATNERTPASYVWDADLGSWLRFQGGTAHLAESGRQLAPANVVLLTIDYTISRADAASPQAITTGSGRSDVYTDGVRIEGTWTRSNSSQGFDILDSDGRQVRLSPGQTFVHLIRDGDQQVLSDTDVAEFFTNAG